MAGTIRDLRLSLNLNQQKIAEIIKSDIPQVSRWGNGLAYPTLAEIIDMSQFFKDKDLFNENIPPNVETYFHLIQEKFVFWPRYILRLDKNIQHVGILTIMQ